MEEDITIPKDASLYINNKDITITSYGETKTIKLENSDKTYGKNIVFNICNSCTVNLKNITIDLSTNKKYDETPAIKVSKKSTLNIKLGTNIKNYNAQFSNDNSICSEKFQNSTKWR